MIWIAINTVSIRGIHQFDPNPFPLLDTGVALEAILPASFILMRQSGLAKRADEREHLMLHLNALMEVLPNSYPFSLVSGGAGQ